VIKISEAPVKHQHTFDKMDLRHCVTWIVSAEVAESLRGFNATSKLVADLNSAF
jgi:hypothetical protein